MRYLFAGFRNAFAGKERLFPLLIVLALGACADSDSPTSPSDEALPDPPSGGEPALAPLAGGALSSGLRVELELVPTAGGWMAREVDVQTGSDLDAVERIESQVTAADLEAGALTLRLGGLRVGIGAEARFERVGGESLTRDEFFAALAASLAAGESPGIEVRRAAVSPPQAPEVAAFEAAFLRLHPDSDDEVLDLNMDERHLDSADGSSGTLTFLGVEVAVDADAGSAVVERSPEQAGAVDLEGMASAADEGTGEITLEDGTILRILPGTRIKANGKRLGSLAEVIAALEAGDGVEVDADAVLESEGVYVAVKVAFKRVDVAGADDGDSEAEGEAEGEGEGEGEGEAEGEGEEAEPVQFGGRVLVVDLEAGTFMMTNGKVLTIGEESAFDEEGELLTLEAMAGALEAGDNVMAEGTALEDEEAGAWMVVEVRAHVNGESGASFGGRVREIDLENGTFTLPNGKVMTVGEETVFDEEGDLTTLEAMAGAVDAGAVVTVEGVAEKDPETGAWLVTELRVNVGGEDGEFGGRVESVDLENGTFMLKNGRTYTVGEETAFDEEGDLLSLEAMAGALAAGDVVTVEGMTERDPETGESAVTALFVETNGEDGPFEGRVDAVDTEAGTFTLKNGRVYTVGGETAFDEGGDLVSLEEMADALADGGKLTVAGEAAQDPETGEWIVSTLSVSRNGKP